MNSFADCESLVTDPLIVLQEKRSKITFNNPRRSTVRRVVVDGCVITKGPRCDYLLINDSSVEHFVELKGSDVRHALAQLESSIRQVSADVREGQKKAFVISTRCPLASTEVQAQQFYFRKKYKTTLIIRASGYKCTI
ncbi:MAG: hypothetical protein A2Z25_23750 [Planctomycetes bacterium RBG_16_55_9]|nr:MAG: hypothetical protein A2Z25_23750 [Planctomycetes bacterium RBG_16_55_9]